jgi:hypothetical protein
LESADPVASKGQCGPVPTESVAGEVTAQFREQKRPLYACEFPQRGNYHLVERLALRGVARVQRAQIVPPSLTYFAADPN